MGDNASKTMRLLLVEDEPRLARRLTRGLREEGYAVDGAATCEEATELGIANEYDLVILDLLLPDGSGLDLLNQWREEDREFPVLVLTARDEVSDKVRGLDAGADDYLTKPFDFDELLARIRSLLRRQPVVPREVLRYHDVELDRTRHRVTRADEEVDLTPKEFALLELFLLHPEAVLDRTTIGERAWDVSYEARTNVIDVLVGRLRQKLEDGGGDRLIQTVRGVGYALRREGEEGVS